MLNGEQVVAERTLPLKLICWELWSTAALQRSHSPQRISSKSGWPSKHAPLNKLKPRQEGVSSSFGEETALCLYTDFLVYASRAGGPVPALYNAGSPQILEQFQSLQKGCLNNMSMSGAEQPGITVIHMHAPPSPLEELAACISAEWTLCPLDNTCTRLTAYASQAAYKQGWRSSFIHFFIFYLNHFGLKMSDCFVLTS